MSECTFHPKINKSKSKINLDHNSSINGQSFNLKQYQKDESIFERLYQNAIDLKKKKQQRFNTLQSQKQQQLLNLSFTPQLNFCSRQIVKRRRNQSVQSLKNYNRHCQSHQNLQPKQFTLNKSNNGKNLNETNKKQQNYTFHPQLSKNTQKMTKNLPHIQKRLQIYQSKKKLSPHKIPSKKNLKKSLSVQKMVVKKLNKPFFNDKQKQNVQILQTQAKKTVRNRKQNENTTQNNKNFHKSTLKKLKSNYSQILKPKKQLYQIDDHQLFTSDSKHLQNALTQIEQNNNIFHDISNTYTSQIKNKTTQSKKQTRSQQLYNNRKNIIFERIFQYLVQDTFMKIEMFSKSLKKPKIILENQQIQANKIINHPYLPENIKRLIYPMTQEMKNLQISLNYEQFIWSLQKIYDLLSIGDKGVLLGWGVKLLPQNSSFL